MAAPDAIPVTSITVTGANGANTITTNNGTLQMSAAVLPVNATNQAVTWSVINGTGSATISNAGLLTAGTNGTVTVKATANDGSSVYGELQITISGQTVAITNFTVNFNLNGGTRTGGGQLVQTVQAGGAATAPTITRSNHSFNGWSSSVAGMTPGNITGNVTFTAQWTWAGGGDDNQGDSNDNGDRDWRVHAQSPRITTQPRNVTVYVSEQATLSVAANITDEGRLTFQWYRAEGVSGGSFRAISGATGSTFNPDTGIIGINRYRVVITNTNNAARITGNRIARTTSHTVTVTVVESAQVATPTPEQMPLPTPTQDPLVNDNFNPPAGAGWQNPFIDVSENDWFFEFVRFAHMNNLFSGTSATTFSPNTPMTRGMMVTVLYRMAGAPDVSGLPNSFTDVADGAWYANAVRWAAANGIVSGIGDNQFAPGQNITREQMAVILTRYATHMGIAFVPIRTGAFGDTAEISGWALQSVNAMYAAGIISGRGGGIFDPQGNATRAEVATLLRNFMEVTGTASQPTTATSDNA